MNNKNITVNIDPRTILVFFGIIAAVGLIYFVSDILILIFVSVVVSAALEPSVAFMEQRKIPRWLAVTIIYVTLLSFIVLAGVLIIPRVTEQIKEISQNLPRLQEGISKLYFSNLINGLFERLSQNSSAIINQLAGVTLGVANGVLGVITFLVLTFYMLVGGKSISIGAINALIPDEKRRKRVFAVSTKISNRMGWWLRGQAFVAVTTFVMVLVGLSIIKVEYALTLALFAGMMEFIPIVGSYLGAIPAVLVALTTSPTKAIVVIIFFVVWQIIQAHIIVPQIMKRVLGVPVLFIFLAVLVFGRLLGFIGIVLAAPITGAITVLINEFSSDMKKKLVQNSDKRG